MTLILSRSDVIAIAHDSEGAALDALIDRVADAYRELDEGLVQQHPRIYLRAPSNDERRPAGLFSMSAVLPRASRMATRLAVIPAKGRGSILALFDQTAQKCLAIIDDSMAHTYRNGAPVALATRYLARPDSEVLGCIGSSGIAFGGLATVARSLPRLREVRVFSPTRENREQFAARMTAELRVSVIAVESAADVAAASDVIVIATNADRAVLADEAIRPGTHINVFARNELESGTLERARLVVGSMWAQRNLDPPWTTPIEDEWLDAELADLVVGRAVGRQSDDEISVFVGSGPLAMWDVAAAAIFEEYGHRLGLGVEVEMTT